MTKITFFELHLDGAEFTANAQGSGQEGTDEDGEAVTDTDESGASPLLALVGLAVLVGVAVAAKKLLGSGDELPPAEPAE